MSQKYFSIKVHGPEGKEIEEGFLDKRTGQPTGTRNKLKGVVGNITIPNFSRVWGKREKDKKDQPTGVITFLPWGDADGHVIEIRHLKAAQSLDKQFQDNVLKVKPQDEELEIRLKLGINDFDTVIDAGIINMLKHHTMNINNKSRNPSLMQVDVFEEYNGSQRVESKQSAQKKRREAEDYINDAVGDTERLAILAHMFDLDAKLQDDILEEKLFDIVEESIDQFLYVIEKAKEKAGIELTEAKEEGILFGQDGGEITIRIEGKALPLVQDLIQEGDDVVTFLLNKLTTPKVYDAVQLIYQRLELNRKFKQ